MLLAVALLIAAIMGVRKVPKTGYKKFPAGVTLNDQIYLQIHSTRLVQGMPQTPDLVGRIPQLAFDASGLGAETYAIVANATQFGYRHFDTTDGLVSSIAFGRAIRNCGIPRKELFISAKILYSDYGSERARQAIDRMIFELGVGYIDLLYMNSPAVKYEEEDEERSVGGAVTIGTNANDEVKGIKDLSTSIRLRIETWRAMEEAVNQGRITFIGVSNFDEDHLWELLQYARIKPAINQVEIHPYLSKTKLIKYCEVHRILVASYGTTMPDGYRNLIHEPAVKKIAKDIRITQKQVLLKWAIDQDMVVIYKSDHDDEMVEALKIFKIKFKLRSQDMKALAELDCEASEDDNENCFINKCEPNCLPGQFYLGTHHVEACQSTSEIREAQDKELELRLKKKFKSSGRKSEL